MSLSPAEQKKWEETTGAIGQLRGPDISMGPLRIPLGCSPEEAEELSPKSVSDLMAQIEEQHALGKVSENDFVIALGFVGNLYWSPTRDADVVELPILHEEDETYIELRFPKSQEGLEY